MRERGSHQRGVAARQAACARAGNSVARAGSLQADVIFNFQFLSHFCNQFCFLLGNKGPFLPTPPPLFLDYF